MSLIFRAVRLSLAAVAIVVVGAVAGGNIARVMSISQIERSATPWCSPTPEPVGQPALPGPLETNEIEIDVDGKTVQARLSTALPFSSPLLVRLQNLSGSAAEIESQLTSFAFDCAAGVAVNNVHLNFVNIEFERPDPGAAIHLTLKTQKRRLEREDTASAWATIAVRGGSSSVIVHSQSALIPRGSWPDLEKNGVATWAAVPGHFRDVSFHVQAEDTDPVSTPEVSHQHTLGQLLHGDSWASRSILYDVSRLIPFLLAWALVIRAPAQNRIMLAPVGILCSWFTIYYALRALYVGLSVLRDYAEDHSKLYKHAIYPWFGAEAFGLIFVALMLPALLAKWMRVSTETTALSYRNLLGEPKRGICLVFGVATLASLGALIWLLWPSSDVMSPLLFSSSTSDTPSLPLFQSLWSAAINPAIWAALLGTVIAATLWLSYELLATRWAAALAPLLCVGLAAAIGLEVIERHIHEPLLSGLVATLSLPFALLVAFFYRHVWIAADSGSRAGAKVPLSRTTLTVIIALLVTWFAATRFPNETIRSRINGASAPIAEASVLMLLSLLLIYLKRLSEDVREVAAFHVRELGTVLVVAFVLWSANESTAVVLVVFCGALILRYWTLVDQTIPSVPPKGDPGADLRFAAAECALRTDAARSLRNRRTELLGKVAKGELNLHAYSHSIEELQGEIYTREHHTRDRLSGALWLLGLGPRGTAWSRGMAGAFYGALASVPWATMFLFSTLQSGVQQTAAGEFVFLLSVAFSLIQWPLMGALFMYFYPNLRGNTGLRKGWVFFTSVALPVLIGAAIGAGMHTVEAVPLFLWIIQLFLECMILGLLVGDYLTFRAAGLGWSELVDLHRFGGVVAWGSSMLLALTGGVVTALSTKAVSWLTSSFQLFNTLAPGGPHR